MTAVASTTIRVNGRDADLARGTVSDGRKAAVALRPQSLAILKLLAVKPGVLVSRDEIMSAVWPNIAVTDDSLVQCVTEIRKALGMTGTQSSRRCPSAAMSSSWHAGGDQSCRETRGRRLRLQPLLHWQLLGLLVQPPATWIGSTPVDRGPAF